MCGRDEIINDILDRVFDYDDDEEPLQLKLCPFCGGEAIFNVLNRQCYRFVAGCPTCNIWTNGTTFMNNEYNARRWNTKY